MQRMKNKVAIITGGAGGIGRAIAAEVIHEGGRVMLVDLHGGPLSDVAATIGGPRIAWRAADVTQSDEVAAYVHATEEAFGHVDVLFDNAGIEGVLAPLTELSEEDFDRVINVNLKGVWLGIKYAVPAMKRAGGGSIVITSSVAGLIGSPGLGAYIASKHGSIGIMRTAALELAPMNIRVNTINPGPVETRMMRSIERMASPDAPEEVKAGFIGKVPLGRYARPEEIASLATFLASDQASYCNGGVYTVDGGFTAG